MKNKKHVYVSPSVETMDCKVERGFQCSGCDGGMLEGLTDGGSANNLFD
ncbi:MAG: hypothetical protein MJZ45_01985 [Bacteroidales bacterium]|nr:hypothetical protein [Bacteroidales bacterium]